MTDDVLMTIIKKNAKYSVNYAMIFDLIERKNAEIDRLFKIVKDYAAAARIIALYLDKFCDRKLPYDKMIAEASRKAAEKLEQSQTEYEKIREIALKWMTKCKELQAEIERLKSESDMADGYEDALVEMTKSEAIKEFTERFRKELFDEIRKTIWSVNGPFQYEQDKAYAFGCIWSCITNKLEELVGD